MAWISSWALARLARLASSILKRSAVTAGGGDRELMREERVSLPQPLLPLAPTLAAGLRSGPTRSRGPQALREPAHSLCVLRTSGVWAWGWSPAPVAVPHVCSLADSWRPLRDPALSILPILLHSSSTKPIPGCLYADPRTQPTPPGCVGVAQLPAAPATLLLSSSTPRRHGVFWTDVDWPSPT